MLKRFSYSLFSLSLLMPAWSMLSAPAQAQCVQIDVAPQIAIHGSQIPSTQINDTTLMAQGPCIGNATATYGAQTAVAPGEVYQERTSTSVINGSTQGLPDVPGLGGPAIQIPVNPQIDVYSPALDPGFMPQGYLQQYPQQYPQQY
jgi:hypothetical protein